MTNKQTFLNTVREQLRRSVSTRKVSLPALENRSSSSEDLVVLFQRQLASVGAHCQVAAHRDQLEEKLLQTLAALDVRSVATSDAETVTDHRAAVARSYNVLPVNCLRDQLFNADVGITEVQWGIAETGTLVLESASERNRLASLVPPAHIALLPRSRIVGTMHDVLARAAPRSNQAITFITGPSRTADIELTLVVGVHGPRSLHVIIIGNA